MDEFNAHAFREAEARADRQMLAGEALLRLTRSVGKCVPVALSPFGGCYESEAILPGYVVSATADGEHCRIRISRDLRAGGSTRVKPEDAVDALRDALKELARHLESGLESVRALEVELEGNHDDAR